MKHIARLLWFVSLTAALGCGAPASKDGTNNVNNANNANNANNSNSSNNSGGALAMELALNNIGNSSVFVSPRPVTIYDQDEALVTSMYPCSCGLPCLASEPAPVQEVRPGQRLSWNWDGALDLGGSCSAEGMVDRELEAEFCYGRSFEGNGVFDGTLVDIVCERVPFTVQAACTDCFPGVIELNVDSIVRPVDPPLRLVLDNQSPGSVYIQLSRDCAAGTWFRILHDDQPLLLTQQCGLCDCSEGTNCVGGCTGACLQDQAVEVPTGATYETDLAGTYLAVYDAEGGQCTQTQFMPDPLVAEICYGTEVMGSLVSNVVCDQTEFFLADREARVIVGAP